jgi:hypothetical protein
LRSRHGSSRPGAAETAAAREKVPAVAAAQGADIIVSRHAYRAGVTGLGTLAHTLPTSAIEPAPPIDRMQLLDGDTSGQGIDSYLRI